MSRYNGSINDFATLHDKTIKTNVRVSKEILSLEMNFGSLIDGILYHECSRGITVIVLDSEVLVFSMYELAQFNYDEFKKVLTLVGHETVVNIWLDDGHVSRLYIR